MALSSNSIYLTEGKINDTYTHAHKQATSNTAVLHLGTFELYPDSFRLQQAPAGTSTYS